VILKVAPFYLKINQLSHYQPFRVHQV